MSNYGGDNLQNTITNLISELYQRAEVEFPASSSIAPLGELIDAFNLAMKELPGLSQRRALEYLLQQEALVEMPTFVGEDELAGFLYSNTTQGCIFVEAEDLLVRRRFSAAHELGHYMLHFRPVLLRAKGYIELTEVLYRNRTDDPEETTSGLVVKSDDMEVKNHLPPVGRMEYEANQFATELLMPMEIVRRLFARAMLRFNEDDINSFLATEMLVSQEAMRRRLKDTHLLPLPERGRKL